MALNLNKDSRYILAKSFTELAIQNGFFHNSDNPADVAKNVALFFDTVAASLDSSAEKSE